MAPSLRVTNVEAGYLPGHPVLRGVSLTAAPGRITVILGPNGAGKSTLLKVIAGFLAPAAGAIALGEEDISALPPHRHVAHGIGLLPQGRSAFPELTVVENIELGGWSMRQDRARLRAAIDAMLTRYPHLQPLRNRAAGSLS